jgi:hypothetical protein
VLCTKTVEEHPMVFFIVVIVETFVHVQHKSSVLPDHWKELYCAGFKEFCTVAGFAG